MKTTTTSLSFPLATTVFFNDFSKHFNPNLENLKTSNVQNADEGGSLSFGSVQSFVNAMDQPAEQTLICCFSQGLNSKVSLEEGRRGRVGKKNIEQKK